MSVETCPCSSCNQVRSRAQELHVATSSLCECCGLQIAVLNDVCADCYESLTEPNKTKKSTDESAARTPATSD